MNATLSTSRPKLKPCAKETTDARSHLCRDPSMYNWLNKILTNFDKRRLSKRLGFYNIYKR